MYAVLEQDDGAAGISLALNRLLILLIVVTLTATVIESVPEMAKAYALPLSVVEWTATPHLLAGVCGPGVERG